MKYSVVTKAQRGCCRLMIAAVTFDSLRKAVGAAVICYCSLKVIVPRFAFPRLPPAAAPPPSTHLIHVDGVWSVTPTTFLFHLETYFCHVTLPFANDLSLCAQKAWWIVDTHSYSRWVLKGHPPTTTQVYVRQ